MTVRILQGDAPEILQTLPERSVHCVVTSPPYWALRSYLKSDDPLKPLELGSEKTPDEHVERMVAVFREVKRVLRDDGLLWVNYGSTYASGDKRPSQSRPPTHVPACGTNDIKPQDFQVSGHACHDCDGEPQAETPSHRGYTVRNGLSSEQAGQPNGKTDHDSGPLDSYREATDYAASDAPLSRQPSSSQSLTAYACAHPATDAASPSGRSTLPSGGLASEHSSACTSGIAEKSGPSGHRTLDKSSSGTALDSPKTKGLDALLTAYSTTESLTRQGQRIEIPWMFALAMQADGWILRDTIIWRKLSPMPASLSGTAWVRCRVKVAKSERAENQARAGDITRQSAAVASRAQREAYDPSAIWQDCPGCDKCRATGGYVLRRGSWRTTPAHEYIFMFAKQAGYFTDPEAVKIPSVTQERVKEYNSEHENMHSLQAEFTDFVLLQETERLQRRRDVSGLQSHLSETLSSKMEENSKGQGQHEGSQREICGNGTWKKDDCSLQSQRKSKGSKAGVGKIGSGQGVASTVEEVGRTQSNIEAICAKREGQSIVDKKPAESEGKGTSIAFLPQASRKDEKDYLHIDGGGVGADQEKVQSSVCLLRPEEDIDEGSCNPNLERREPHGGKHCSGVSELQCEEVQSLAKINPRSVMSFKQHNLKEKHYAAFPPALAEFCIKASTSPKGVCPTCGAQWARVIDKSGGTLGHSWHDHRDDDSVGQRKDHRRAASDGFEKDYCVKTIGFRPTCTCARIAETGHKDISGFNVPEPVPATILDPFGGSGTVGLVSDRLGHDAILIELNHEYATMSRRRITKDAGMFASVW